MRWWWLTNVGKTVAVRVIPRAAITSRPECGATTTLMPLLVAHFAR